MSFHLSSTNVMYPPARTNFSNFLNFSQQSPMSICGWLRLLFYSKSKFLHIKSFDVLFSLSSTFASSFNSFHANCSPPLSTLVQNVASLRSSKYPSQMGWNQKSSYAPSFTSLSWLHNYFLTCGLFHKLHSTKPPAISLSIRCPTMMSLLNAIQLSPFFLIKELL